MTRMGYYCNIHRYSRSIWYIWDVWNITGLFTSICDICGYVWYTISIWIYIYISLSLFNLDMNGRLLGYSLTINGILASGYYWNNITYNTIRDIWIHTHIYIWINRNGIQWDKQLGIFHGTKKCGTAKLGTKSQLMSIIIQQTQQNESLRVYLKNNP